MKIWVNKCINEEKTEQFREALTFNIGVPGQGGVVASDIRTGWYNLGCKGVSSICEDLFIIALSVFAADKRIPRAYFKDAWTRTLNVSIPVLELEKWQNVKKELEQLLSFLSGDIWKLNFRIAGQENRYQDGHKREPRRPANLNSMDAVALFSGGMDSYCGAYKLLSQRKKTVFVGFKEYDRLKDVQEALLRDVQTAVSESESILFRFTAKAYAPLGGQALPTENTSRSRSFLFLSAALCVAEIIGEGTPVYIPENGFIGLNLPMTPGRKGSCSTRTTHPYFLKKLNELTAKIGICHSIINPYAFMTKREMVLQYKDTPGFLDNIHKTISCSHPRNGRWKGITQPENCGYCYPCLIRQASLIGIDVPDEHYAYDTISYDYVLQATNHKRSDLVDLLSAVGTAKKMTDMEILTRIRRTGYLTREEAEAFLHVYRETINDLVELFSRDRELLRIMGLLHATD